MLSKKTAIRLPAGRLHRSGIGWESVVAVASSTMRSSGTESSNLVAPKLAGVTLASYKMSNLRLPAATLSDSSISGSVWRGRTDIVGWLFVNFERTSCGASPLGSLPHFFKNSFDMLTEAVESKLSQASDGSDDTASQR